MRLLVVERTVLVGEELQAIDAGGRTTLNAGDALVGVEGEFVQLAIVSAFAASRHFRSAWELEDILCRSSTYILTHWQ
jgi:hypothetical protein